ncbi:MAG TPA: PaaI family thioesterase [Bacteroides sp.]|nr:PaaI family thioesterase [Bacteroides sp.]
MEKLKNPYADLPGYCCFGCSPHNPAGLRMEFRESGEEIISTWQPDAHFQGFVDILHGGIQATMMDEIASWVVFVKLQTAGVTLRLNTRYRKPVRLSAGAITLRAKVVRNVRNIATIEVHLFDGGGRACSEGVVEYFLLSSEKARTEMHYPGLAAFYSD